jgi:hypothetical protein
MSVATWSLRLRAVWSFAAAGTRLVSACSMFMWTSSSRSSHAKRPPSISPGSRPARHGSRSAPPAVISPTWASIAEWALLPAMSKGASRRSNETDSLNFSISSAGPE